MGDYSQVKFGARFLPKDAKTVIEIGSKNYGNTASFRAVYPKSNYIGVDLERGDGVDVIWNMEKGIGTLPKCDVCICCSVLEHTPKPWKAAENITKIVRKGGYLYISVPWVQRYHPYPDDYYRFSHSGIKALFPDFEWGEPYLLTFPKNHAIKWEYGADNIRCIMHEGLKYMPYFHFNMIGVRK